MILMSTRSADSYLKNGMSLDSWESPISNISQGNSVSAIGEDINDIAWQAAELSSFLSAVSASQDREFKQHYTENLSSWKKKVRVQALQCNPSLNNCFEISVQMPGGFIETKIGFLYGSYAAEFGIVKGGDTRSFLTQLHSVQAKLWQLDQLREIKRIPSIEEPELIIKPESNQDQSTFDLLEEIKFEANHREISVIELNNAKHVAKYIVNKAA